MTIIQNSYGDADILAEVSSPAWRAYAARHGYSYVLSHDQPPRKELRAPWSKLPGIIRALDGARNDVILYVDVDTVPIEKQVGRAAFLGNRVLEDGRLIGLVRAKESVIIHSSKREWWNTGVMFIRSCDEMRVFFADVLEQGDVPGQEWTGEQARINHELEIHGIQVQALDNQYNTYTLAPSKTPFIRAFHGETDNRNAARLMELALAGKLRF